MLATAGMKISAVTSCCSCSDSAGRGARGAHLAVSTRFLVVFGPSMLLGAEAAPSGPPILLAGRRYAILRASEIIMISLGLVTPHAIAISATVVTTEKTYKDVRPSPRYHFGSDKA